MLHPTPTSLSRTGSAPRQAFSLIELLTVTAIIAILVGMVGSAAFAARQQAYRAQAQAELRELSSAIRSYWITYGAWPLELEPFAGNPDNFTAVSKKLMESLMGKRGARGTRGANTRGIVFINIDDKHFGADNTGRADMYLDPWGNAYEISLAAGQIERSSLYTTSTAFPMRERYSVP